MLFFVFKRQFRLYLRKYSFSQRVIDDWNSLPEDVVSSKTINQFKNRLNKFWKNKNTKFDPDCYSYPLAHARSTPDMKGTKSRETIQGLNDSKTLSVLFPELMSGSSRNAP